MTTNPVYNALFAAAYITAVAHVMFYGSHLGGEETVLIPVAILSLFVLSAAVMACLFFYQPLLLVLDGKRQEAVSLVVRTILSFGAITALLFTTWILSS